MATKKRSLRTKADQVQAAERCYAAAAEILVKLKEEFDAADAASVLLCALGRIAAIQNVPEPQAWNTIIAEDCHAGFRFGYLNQSRQLAASVIVSHSEH